MVSKKIAKTGVIIMTYGSATTADHVAEYMHHIYKDKVPEGLIEDFAERYRLVGHSPLIEITQQQAALLSKELNHNKTGQQYVVKAGMLHSQPYIEGAVKDYRNDGADGIIGIILSPAILIVYYGRLPYCAKKSLSKAWLQRKRYSYSRPMAH